jgi:hypothetical protein
VKAILFYALFFLASGGAFAALYRLHRRGGLDALTPRRAALAGGALLALGFAIAETPVFFEDFVDAYSAGGKAILAGKDVRELFANGAHGFVNVPIVAVVFAPVAVLPARLAALVFFAAGVAASAALWLLLVRVAQLGRGAALVLGVLVALNGPLLNSLREGNTSHFALLAVVAALLLARQGKELLAGALIGAACLVKLPLLVFGAYFAITGRIRAAFGAGLVVGAAGLSSIALFGLDVHRLWYETFVASASDRPIAAFNVQSVAALIARFERTGDVLCDWAPGPLGQGGRAFAAAVSVLTVLTVIAVCGRARWLEREHDARSDALGRDIEWACVLILACVTSPLAWSHYYCFMLLPIALLLGPRHDFLGKRGALAVASIAALLVTLPVAWPGCNVEQKLRDALPLALAFYKIAVAHYLLGAYLLLGCLLALRSRLSAPRAAADRCAA